MMVILCLIINVLTWKTWNLGGCIMVIIVIGAVLQVICIFN